MLWRFATAFGVLVGCACGSELTEESALTSSLVVQKPAAGWETFPFAKRARLALAANGGSVVSCGSRAGALCCQGLGALQRAAPKPHAARAR
jgi:hypothetical protein